MAFQKPVGVSYSGPSGIARVDSIWLTFEDLPVGKDVKVTIEDVILYRQVTFEGGRTKTNLVGIKFVGKERVLGLNATNRKILAGMFSSATAAWKGKEITLYIGRARKPGTKESDGEQVDCVRIRDRGNSAAQQAQAALHAPPAAGASDPVSATTTGAEPAGEITTPEQLFTRFKTDCERATRIWNGERVFIENILGTWSTCDPKLADPPVSIYNEDEKALLISPDHLSELMVRLVDLVK
jgi:hypothetical protein